MSRGRLLWGAALALGLAGCEPVVPDAVSSAAVDSSAAPPLRPNAVAAQPSAASEELRVYYQRLEADLLVQGLLRTDGGGPDTPFTARQLATNFIQIALYDEYRTSGDTLVARQTEASLRKWTGPVRIAVEFSDTVPEAQRAKDRADLARYATRLSRVTGLDISVGRPNPNFHVLVLDDDDRREAQDRLIDLAPWISPASLREVVNLPRPILCVVLAFSRSGSDTYNRAIAIVRAEHPDLLRLACYHEEIAQGLGLANDSPGARPSIFNDDEEFGLLTTHDELLLRILYDDALKAGMSVTEAEPIAQRLAAEVLGE